MKRVLQLFLFVPFLYFGSKTLAQDTIVISHPETNVQAGVTFCLDIKANQFEDLLGIQFALAWDESVLTYQNIEVNQPNSTDPYLPNLNAVNFGIQGGVARFVWTEQGSSPITLAENSTLFQICFKANESGNTALRLSDDIVGEAVKASNFSIIPVVGQNSTINVNEDGDDLGAARIKIADKTITARDQFCVPVTADQFGSLVGLQFQIEWDERLLELKDVRPNQALLDEITPTSLSTSRRDLKFSWLEPSLTSLEIPDNSVLFELCFESTFDYATTTEIGFGEAVPFEATRIEAGTPVVFPVLLESSSITIESEQVVAEAQLAIASKTVNSGESFCLPITAAGFESLTSLQFSLEWDDSVLAYTGIAFYEDPLGMSYQQTPSYIEAADEFKLIWWSGDDNLNVIVADDTPLFELCFDAIGEAAVETLVEFNESIPLEATRVEEGVLLEIPVNTEDGVIQISRSNNSSASLSIADQAVESGASFCLPITANRFGSVTGMQFS
ncbi:MAG: cohesin domain-containing protein, partial [Bacteroidota bacterium]